MKERFEKKQTDAMEEIAEFLPEKRDSRSKIIALIRDRYFWYLVVLAAFIAVFSYAPEISSILGLSPRPNWELDYYVALYRVTFVISITIASWRFGISGGLITCLVLTPVLFSPYIIGLREPNIWIDLGLVVLGVMVGWIIGRQGNLQRLLASTAMELQRQTVQLRQEITDRERVEKEVRTLSLAAIESLVFALEAKDQYTAGHSRRVTDVACAIGRRMHLSADELEDLRCSSLLHDIGKIAVEHAIQNKPDKLSSNEYEHIMIHVNAGANIVKPIVNDKVVALIEHHHDYYDGGNINQVVAGQNIPLGARIIAVADAFDAMTSDRPYRSAMSTIEAIEEIKRCNGTQFDPAVVKVFLQIPLAEITLKSS